MATNQEAPFEAVGFLAYDPITDSLVATAWETEPSLGPPISVTAEHFLLGDE